MADDPNVTLFKQLYSKIAEALSVGTPTAVPGQNYLALCNPGILLDPAMRIEREPGQHTWATLLDNVPNPNWVYTPTNQPISRIYEQILRGKELPKIELTRAQQEQLTAAQEVVMTREGEETPKFKAYIRYQGNYQTALTGFMTAQTTAANSGESVRPELQTALNQARANWNTFGFKAQVEGAQATITNLLQLNPDTWWAQLENEFENAKAGKNFEPSTTYPGYEWFNGQRGWTRFTFTQEDVTRQATSSSVEGGGGVKAGWGLWSVSAEASYREATRTSASDTTGIQISMDVMRATIMRPWLEPLVFRAHTWRLSKASPLYGSVISKGTFIPGEAKAGAMPLLPTGILVARNVQIGAQFSHQDQTTVERALSASASVGWGPFAIQGHYGQREESSLSHGSATGTTISNADPQILAFFCDVLPLCPSPDPSLPWPATV